MVERARADGSASPRDIHDGSRAGQLNTTSLQAQPHAVPDWLISPRSTPTGSKRLSSENSSLLPQPGLPGHADSISPGSIHRLNVFGHPASQRVSSEASAEAAPNRAEEEGKAALKKDVVDALQQNEDVAAKQSAHQVTTICSSIKQFLLEFQIGRSHDSASTAHSSVGRCREGYLRSGEAVYGGVSNVINGIKHLGRD